MGQYLQSTQGSVDEGRTQRSDAEVESVCFGAGHDYPDISEVSVHFPILHPVYPLIEFRQTINLGFFRASGDFDRLGRASQRIVDLLLLNRSIFVSELRTQISDIKDVIAEEQAQTRTVIQELVLQRGITQAISASYVQSTTAACVEKACRDPIENEIWRWLVDSLAFPAMRNREDEIAPAYHSTFKWIFREPSTDLEPLPWTNFIHWLRQGDGLYWINGKAGSGKSTLMKYIFNDKRTSKALSGWAGSMPLMIANFFFWNSGTREQRSQLGLLRSLLFQILQHQPTIAPLIFPDECAKLQSRREKDTNHLAREQWTLSRLQGSLHRFIKLTNLPMKVCFFIDGLDEFEGNDEHNDPLYLANLLQSLATSPFVKICASSRPLLIFEKAFQTNSGLRLQDLTTGDIRRYVHHKLTEDERIQQLAVEEPLERAYFIKEISEKAHGVFLWVKLVVRSLLDGLGNHDRIQDLKARLELLPADLQELYRHMLMRIEPLYLQKASEVFQLIRTAQQVHDLHRKDGQRTTSVTVLQLSFAISKPSENAADTGRWSTESLTSQCDTMRSRLQTWCAGLLEVPDFIWNRVDPTDPSTALRTKVIWEVAYLHRTARDFLETESIWTALLEYTANTSFEPYSWLLRSTQQLYEVVGPLVPTPLGHGLFKGELLQPLLEALIYAQRSTAISGDAHFETLERLDEIAGNHLSRWSGRYLGHWSQFIDQKPAWYENFLDVAVAYDLHGYVAVKIDQEHRKFLSKVKQGLVREDPNWAKDYFKRYKRGNKPSEESTQQPGLISIGAQYYAKKREVFEEIDETHPITLLDIALQRSFPDPNMIDVLLDHGADPNEASGSERLWEHVLRRTEASSRRGAEGKAWLHIIGLFLTYGVDARGYNAQRRRLKQNRDTAKLLLWKILDGFDPALGAEVESLKTVIDKTLPWSKKHRMKTWRQDTFRRSARGRPAYNK